jgi:catechol 2,3-dioxygenase-like lactoylglutathione lyase family enzyme
MKSHLLRLLLGCAAAPAVFASAPPALEIAGLAHVAFQSASLPVSRAHYTGMLGYERAYLTAGPEGEVWHFKVNDGQFVQLVAGPSPTADNRLVEVAFRVADAARAHAALTARGLAPTAPETRPDGTRATTLRDPDGHRLAFVEYPPGSQPELLRGRHLGARRASDRLWHTGVAVADEARALAFYRDRLGFVETWRGGPEGAPIAWINLRPPGPGGDYLELMLAPTPPDRARLGSMHHVCFQVVDIRAANAALSAHGMQDVERHHPRLGRNQRWLFNVSDPDGTRAEYMEPLTATHGRVGVAADEPVYFLSRPGALARTKARLAAGDPAARAALDALVREAEAALRVAPPSVTHKTRPGASGDLHDYSSIAPYLWPDPTKPDGLPYIPRDGEVNPANRDPAVSDRERLRTLGETVETLALAYAFTGKETYAAHAARCLRVWFLDPATRMNPHFEFAQAVPGRNTGRGIGIIEAGGMIGAADAAGLLAGSGAWTAADQAGLRAWLDRYLTWLLTSGHGRYEQDMRQNHGTMFDFNVARIALLVDRPGLARRVIAEAGPRRVAVQIEPDGSQPMELRRTKGLGYSELNLRGLVWLALLGERLGVDLWSYRTADGRSIRAALDFLRPHLADPAAPWPYEQITAFDRGEFAPLYRVAASAYADADYAAFAARSPAAARFNLLYPPEPFPGNPTAGGAADRVK